MAEARELQVWAQCGQHKHFERPCFKIKRGWKCRLVQKPLVKSPVPQINKQNATRFLFFRIIMSALKEFSTAWITTFIVYLYTKNSTIGTFCNNNAINKNHRAQSLSSVAKCKILPKTPQMKLNILTQYFQKVKWIQKNPW